MTSGQQAAAELLDAVIFGGARDRAVEAIAAALAEAARPGQELRARVAEYASELERIPGSMTAYAADVAVRLRAALEDPRTAAGHSGPD